MAVFCGFRFSSLTRNKHKRINNANTAIFALHLLIVYRIFFFPTSVYFRHFLPPFLTPFPPIYQSRFVIYLANKAKYSLFSPLFPFVCSLGKLFLKSQQWLFVDFWAWILMPFHWPTILNFIMIGQYLFFPLLRLS